MQDYVIAIDSEQRLGAFYIKDDQVHFTYQKDLGDKTQWTGGKVLPPRPPVGFGKLSRIEVCTDSDQNVQIIVVNTDWEYFITYQTHAHVWSNVYGGWEPWAKITQS